MLANHLNISPSCYLRGLLQILHNQLQLVAELPDYHCKGGSGAPTGTDSCKVINGLRTTLPETFA